MSTGTHDHSTKQGGSFLIGLIAGGAIGAGLTLYFAPRLASELRRRATDSTTDLLNAMSRRVQGVATGVADVVERVTKVADHVAKVADEVTRTGQAARDEVADAVARGAHEVGRGAREVEQFAKASKTDRNAAPF